MAVEVCTVAAARCIVVITACSGLAAVYTEAMVDCAAMISVCSSAVKRCATGSHDAL